MRSANLFVRELGNVNAFCSMFDGETDDVAFFVYIERMFYHKLNPLHSFPYRQFV